MIGMPSCGKAGHSVTRCPVLDKSFPFMLPGWRAEKTPGGYIMISPRVAAERHRAENGDWISSKIGPQDPGGGATRIAAPRGVVDMEVTSSPMSSVVEPQSVPSRILVVLVEETKVRGTECLVSPRVASPASVNVVGGRNVSPCVVGTLSPSDSVAVGPDGMLSSSDLAGMLFPAIPAGILFQVGPVGPYGTLSPSDSDSVGPYVTLSPSDTVAVGPVGSYGTPPSPSDSDSVGPYVTLSPSDSDSVGLYGTLSPSDYVAVGPVGPDGMLSSSDLAGILFPAVPTGIPSPVGSVGPVSPYNTLSQSDTAAVGPDGTLSSSDLAGILFPAVPTGIPSAVGPCGTLSLSGSESVVLVDPGGTLSSSGLAGIMVPDVSAGLLSLIGPVKTLGELSPSDSDFVGPVGPTGMLSSSVCECARPVGPVGRLLPCDGVPIVPTGELSLVEAVLFPGERDPVITLLPAEILMGYCSDVVNMDVTESSCWAVLRGIGDPAVVAMVGLDMMLMGEGLQLHGADKCAKCAEWDIRDEFETIYGMPVYYGGDLCDSDESDCEDPYDIAYAEEVEQYNFDALEGMELKGFMRLKGPDESVMLSERTVSTHVCPASSSYRRRELDTVGMEPVADLFNERHDVPDAAVSPNRRSCSETYGGGTALYYEGDISDSDCGSVEDRERDTWEDWCDSAFRKMDTVPFHRIRMIYCRRWCSVTNCFRMKTWPICLCRIIAWNCLCQHYMSSRRRGASGSPGYRSDCSDR